VTFLFKLMLFPCCASWLRFDRSSGIKPGIKTLLDAVIAEPFMSALKRSGSVLLLTLP
jgi:hypothetical protein